MAVDGRKKFYAGSTRCIAALIRIRSKLCLILRWDTPITYVTKLRLRKSLAALLDSDKSITDIAYEYGFCGASYYCESFQKYYGMSPLQYKKRTNTFNPPG